MIGPGSRYANIDTATLSVVVDGQQRTIRYLRRRFPPAQTGAVTLLSHTITQADRVDNLAALYFTDPLQFWRLDELFAQIMKHLDFELSSRSSAARP